MRSAHTILTAHLRLVSMWIKFSFNYRWVRSHVLTFGWICARTPPQCLKKQGKMLPALEREKSWLVTITDLCLQGLLLTPGEVKLTHHRNSDTALSLWAWGSVDIPPVRVNQQTGKLMSGVIGHANEIWVSASWLFCEDQKFRRFLCFGSPYQKWTWSLGKSPWLYGWIVDCFWWPHALCQRTQSPFRSRCGLSQEHGTGQTLALGDKEPCTAVWDQTALAPNAGRQHLLHVAQTRQANNTPWQGDTCCLYPRCSHCSTHAHTPTPLCHKSEAGGTERLYSPHQAPARKASLCLLQVVQTIPKKPYQKSTGQLPRGTAVSWGWSNSWAEPGKLQATAQHTGWESTPLRSS